MPFFVRRSRWFTNSISAGCRRISKSSWRRLNLPMHVEQSLPRRKGQSLRCPRKTRCCGWWRRRSRGLWFPVASNSANCIVSCSGSQEQGVLLPGYPCLFVCSPLWKGFCFGILLIWISRSFNITVSFLYQVLDGSVLFSLLCDLNKHIPKAIRCFNWTFTDICYYWIITTLLLLVPTLRHSTMS